MATKVKMVVLIIGAVTACYLILTLVVPILVDFSTTANTTITASSNWSDYPGSQAVLVGAPFWIYFVPAIIGIISIVVVLRSK